MKRDSGKDVFGRATDAHGFVLQARSTLSVGVYGTGGIRCSRGVSDIGGSIGAGGAGARKYGGKQKGWSVEEDDRMRQWMETEVTKRRLRGLGGRTLFNAVDIDPYRHTRESATLYHPHG